MPDDRWARKFGLKAGQRLLLIDCPAAERAILLQSLPEAAQVDDRAETGVMYEQILYWPRHTTGLADRLRRMARLIVPDGAIWLVIPKRSFQEDFGVTMSWDQMQAEALTTDLVDNKTATYSLQTYGTRFVIRRSARPLGGG